MRNHRISVSQLKPPIFNTGNMHYKHNWLSWIGDASVDATARQCRSRDLADEIYGQRASVNSVGEGALPTDFTALTPGRMLPIRKFHFLFRRREEERREEISA